eukprot:CAMPEP_0171056792 /NCGR_PEP_ID=MMETSP0766_2-20121228/1327_1 /TAXON_ID=439317 /ORGANISM="Gambierdiscus australes, Strain CAWD 149" /LENGTH=32 /DNA_ID= /DNA_START= /DNA_END= /DNA_ORIENTATION=
MACVWAHEMDANAAARKEHHPRMSSAPDMATH